MTAPCGVPCSVGCHPCPVSSTPCFRYFSSSLRMRPSALFLFHQLEQFVLRDAVEVALQVRVHHPRLALCEQGFDARDGLPGVASGSESIAVSGEAALEDRLQHIQERGLHHAVPHGRNTQRSLLLRSQLLDPHPLDWPWLVTFRLQQPRKFADGLGDVRFEKRAALTIDACRAVFADHRPCRQVQMCFVPHLVHQSKPFASFNASFEGCQHALGPHRAGTQRKSALPLRCFPGLLRRCRHCRRCRLARCVLHAFTFLPPLAPRSLPASQLLWRL